MNEKLMALSLPFAFSLVIMILQLGVRSYAMRAVRLTWTVDVDFEAAPVKKALDLAVHVYTQLSFILSSLLAAVTCLYYSTRGDKPIYGLLSATWIIAVVGVWVMWLVGLSAGELKSWKGTTMKLAGIMAVLVQWLLAIDTLTP